MTMIENNNPLDDFVERFHQFAVTGDAEKIESFAKGNFDIDVVNPKGWTALMFSARNGHCNVTKLLLDKGCDVTKVNSSGQTALDIAQFWSHTDIVDLLGTKNPISSPAYTGLPNQGMNNFFSHNPLDRAHYRRTDASWLTNKMKSFATKWCLFKDLSPYVIQQPDHSKTKLRESYKLVTAQYSDISDYMSKSGASVLVIFLGLERDDYASETSLKDRESADNEAVAWFALDVSSLPEEKVKEINVQAEITNLYPAGLFMNKKHAGIMAQARSVMAWHDRYSFCPTCGSKTKVEDAGYKRTCIDEKCRSNKGIHNTCYPRTDPTVIMAVISPDRKKLLFGRSERHPKHMWSCLAGFMEPGESIEDAVRRETFEESGVKVGRVEYHSCQPWPMPSTLMIGCLAFAESEEIIIDKEELQDARWFKRKEAVQMLTRQHPEGLYCPPDQAIAHQLIKAWVHMTSNL